MSAGCSLAWLNAGFRITESPTDPGHRHEGEQVKQSLHDHEPGRFGVNNSLLVPELIRGKLSAANDAVRVRQDEERPVKCISDREVRRAEGESVWFPVRSLPTHPGPLFNPLPAPKRPLNPKQRS